MITPEELRSLKAEIDNWDFIRHQGPLVAEEDQGMVYILREGGRQPVMMMPRDVYDQLLSYEPERS